MGDDASDDDSDEWGMEELTIPAASKIQQDKGGSEGNEDNEDFWATAPAAVIAEPTKEDDEEEEKKTKPPAADDRPLIIVDMTQLNPDIHNKFDKNGCSDSEAASALRKQIEQQYDHYATGTELLETGTVIPCGMSVWRGALAQLREERPGHYFAPVFPPKK